MKKTLKWSLVMMLAVVGITFASCSDDDDNTPTVGTVEDVKGEFTGKMTYAKEAKEAAATGTTLDLKVANDSIEFAKFPYEALVVSILGEEGSKPIIAAIGDSLQYNVSYTATMNAAKDSVVLTLKPEPLKLEAVGVEVTITAEKTASYAIKDKNLKFNLKATEAKLAGVNALETPIDLTFDMKKK